MSLPFCHLLKTVIWLSPWASSSPASVTLLVMKTFYKDARSSPCDCQSMETMDPKKLEFPQESMLGKERGEGWCQLGSVGRVVFWKVSHSPDRVSDHHAGETGAETTMNRTTRCPGQLSHVCLGILFKPKPHVGTLKIDLGVGHWTILFPSPMWTHRKHLFCSALLLACLISLLTKTSLFRLLRPGGDPSSSTLLRSSHTFHCWDPNLGLLLDTCFYLTSHQIQAQTLPVHLQNDCWVNQFLPQRHHCPKLRQHHLAPTSLGSSPVLCLLTPSYSDPLFHSKAIGRQSLFKFPHCSDFSSHSE